jgi:hypothetical protein
MHEASFACQLTMPSPLTEFDSSEYVFIGEVTDVVGPLWSDRVRGEAWGLRIAVKEKVFLPRSPATYVEVYEYGLAASCEAFSIGRESLFKSYPIGSVVRVIAKESTHFASRLPNGDLRLDGGPFNQRAIVSKVYSDEPFFSRASSVYDFRTPVDLDAYEKRRKNSGDGDALWWWYRGVVKFELRKELLRLRNAASASERAVILERLAYYPRSVDAEIDYPMIAKSHIKDPNRRKALLEVWGTRH